MNMKITEKGTKKFTVEEKLAILEEGSSQGVKVTLAKYGLYPSYLLLLEEEVTCLWRGGIVHRRLKDREAQIKKLEKENEQLKLLLAEKQLEGRLKDEMLKKKYPELRKRL